MLTNDDIQKLKEVLATKDDLAKLVSLEEFDIFQKDTKQEFTSLRESLQSLIVSVDKLAKSLEIYHDEYVAMTVKVDVHEKWIKQIAKKVGLKLEF